MATFRQPWFYAQPQRQPSPSVGGAAPSYALSTTVSAPATGTMCCWAKCLTAGTAGTVIEVSGAGGVAAKLFCDTNDHWWWAAGLTGATDLGVSDLGWTFLAASWATAGSGNIYYGTGAPGLTAAGFTALTLTPDNFSIYNTRAGNSSFQGTIRYAKLWSAVLTQAELEVEYLRGMPRKTANLTRLLPLWSSAVAATDVSGNGLNMTVTSTMTDTSDSPPITFGG